MTDVTNGVPGPIRWIGIIDTETTGTDPAKSRCIEVAVMLYDLKHAQPAASFASLIRGDGSNEAESINGIPGAMLPEARDADEVWRCVRWLLKPAQALLAHRAEFDRQFVPDLGLPWVCSKVDVSWVDSRRGDHLVQLALSLGLGVASAHRAMADVDTLARILTRVAEKGGDLGSMMRHAMRPKQRFVSLAPYEERETVKANGFLWNPDKKIWWRDMPPEDAKGLPFQVSVV